MNSVAVGIDIGGTNTVSGLVDMNGKCYGMTSFKTREYVSFEEYVARICSDIEGLLASNAECELAGIGIGAPNANRFSGCIENPANLRWKLSDGSFGETFPLVELVGCRFPSVPVVMTNDANAAALGEMFFGGARGMKDFVVITLGTGLGSGFVSGGDIIYGHDSYAGELGHIIVEHNGRSCGCGNCGCLETYVSASGIKRTALELLSQCNSDSLLRRFTVDNLESKDIYDAAVKGDEIALKAFDITGRYLGLGIATAVAITSPEAVFLFGGLARSGDLLTVPTKKYMEKYMLEHFRGKVKLLLSSVDGQNAAVLGASALAWQMVVKAR